MSKNNKSSNELGAGLVEAGIALPLLLLILFGIVEFGRIFSQMIWIGRTGYEAAVRGANFSPGLGETEMKRRITMIYDVLGVNLSSLNKQVAYNLEDGTNQVSVKIQSKVQNILQFPQNLGFNLSVTGPVMIRQLLGSTDLTRFENPSGEYVYDCSAHEGTLECTQHPIPPPGDPQEFDPPGGGKYDSQQWQPDCPLPAWTGRCT